MIDQEDVFFQTLWDKSHRDGAAQVSLIEDLLFNLPSLENMMMKFLVDEVGPRMIAMVITEGSIVSYA